MGVVADRTVFVPTTLANVSYMKIRSAGAEEVDGIITTEADGATGDALGEGIGRTSRVATTVTHATTHTIPIMHRNRRMIAIYSYSFTLSGGQEIVSKPTGTGAECE